MAFLPFKNILNKLGLNKDTKNQQNLSKIQNDLVSSKAKNTDWKEVEGQVQGQNNNIQIYTKNSQLKGKGIGKIANLEGSAMITLAQNLQNLEYIPLHVTAKVKYGKIRISLQKPGGQIIFDVVSSSQAQDEPQKNFPTNLMAEINDFSILEFGFLKFKIETLTSTASQIEYMVNIN